MTASRLSMQLKPDPSSALQRRLKDALQATLLGAGHSERSAAEVSREAFRWGQTRIAAAANRRGILAGWGVAWTASGQAELLPIEVPRPGRRQVTIRIDRSAISPGTERALYLRLPNAKGNPLARPGYSAAGVVIETGDAAELRPGDRVAVTGAPHSSVVTVDASAVYRIPAGVSTQAAALVELAVIAGQGLRHAALRAGEPFCVVGIGPVGALAQRLAVAEGGVPRAVVARSTTKRPIADAAGTERFLLADDADAVAALRVPLVIEATGSPDGVRTAIAAAGEGARVVLLGSPRGVTSDLPVGEIRSRRIALIGSHVGTLERDGSGDGRPRRRALAESFVAALAADRLVVDDLIGPAIDPREAARFYRDLVERGDVIGAQFDWARLRPEERVRRGRFTRFPDLRARGVDASRPPLPPRRSRNGAQPGILGFEDPFAGAAGHLRIGLLGCGDIARYNSSAIAAAPNAELTACFDPAAGLAQDLADRFGADVAPSAEALLEHPRVDAVFISVPHHLHAQLAAQAAAAGRHVIVDKPQAHTLAAAVEMARVCERAGVALTVCFPQRYDPRVVIARRLIEAGALGAVGGFSVRFLVDRAPGYWVGGFSGRSTSDWRSSRERAGGGVLIMNLSHYLDEVRHLLGVEAEAVDATAAAVDRPSEVEDAVSVTLAGDGVVGSVFGSSAVRGINETELRLWGRDGHVVVEPQPAVFTLRALDGLVTGRWHGFGRLPTVDARAVFVSRFATALAEGRAPDVTAADGIAAQAIIEAAYRSSETGVTAHPAELAKEAGWPSRS